MQSKMFQMAKEVLGNAYAPYSNFQVGVCLRTANDDFFVGCNVENVSYGLTLCAEACALGTMLSSRGFQQIQEVAIVSSGKQTIFPCGACRQRLSEFSMPETIFHLQDGEGRTLSLTFGELFPYSFNSTHLGVL